MKIRNITNTSVTLSFIPLVLAPGQLAEISDAFLYHPMFIPLINKTISVDSTTVGTTTSTSQLTSSQRQALDSSIAPSSSNPYATTIPVNDMIQQNYADHHTNRNDPSANQKEALNAASLPSKTNPFATESKAAELDTDSMDYHIAHYDHTPSPLSLDEIESIQHSTTPSSVNPMMTASYGASIVSSAIGTHASSATIHHTNVNDPSVNQKAALDGSATPSVSNVFLTTSVLTAHTASSSAHHSNANDPTSSEKLAMTNASPSPSGSVPFVTTTDTRIPTLDQKGGLAGTDGTPSASNKYVTNSDSRLATAGHLSTDEKGSLTSSLPLPTAANPVVTEGHARMLSTNQKAAVTGATTPSGTNVFLTASDMTTHAAIATVHHSNASDPTSDQKAALAGTDGTPSGTNKYVTNTDARMTNVRTPAAHTASHTDGTDDIRSGTPLLAGLVTANQVKYIYNSLRDVRLIYHSTTEAELVGLDSGMLSIGGEIQTITSRIVTTTDNILSSTGTDSGAAMVMDTTYYIYCSNSVASFAPSTIRASLTAPTLSTVEHKKVLGLTGNAVNWVFVGWVHTNSAVEMPDELMVASYYNSAAKSVSADIAAVGPVAVDDTWENITGCAFSFLFQPGAIIEINATMLMKCSTLAATMSICLDAGGFKYSTCAINEPVADNICINVMNYRGINDSTDIALVTASVQHKYSTLAGSSTNGVFSFKLM